MRLIALALDYDGTLAMGGAVAPHVKQGLQRIKRAGIKLILVTGRELLDLQRTFPELDLFDAVVAENGARLFLPEKHEDRQLSPFPPPKLVQAIRARGVEPLDIGETVIATRQPNEVAVLDAIKETGVEWQIVFNKGAVMCLPSGINKGSGLQAALKELRLSSLNVFAIGDAENDISLLAACGLRGAVANALDSVKQAADLTAVAEDGDGVLELFERCRNKPLEQSVKADSGRYELVLGKDSHGNPVRLGPGSRLFIAGASQSGKSHLTTLVIERMHAAGFQTCVLDPEGDYENLPDTTVLGGAKAPPELQEVAKILEDGNRGLVVNLIAVDFSARPRYFSSIVGLIRDLRARYGRPHWLVADEAHHCIPADAGPPADVGEDLSGFVLISADPEKVAAPVLAGTTEVIVVGEGGEGVLQRIADVLGQEPPTLPASRVMRGEALLWKVEAGTLSLVTPDAPEREHQRHVRKYAQGALDEDNSFYFKGPRGALNLRAQNLTVFLQLADGVDDETWTYHLRQRDYSRWFRKDIKDRELAAGAEQVEQGISDDPRESRRRIRDLVNRLYTAPADPSGR